MYDATTYTRTYIHNTCHKTTTTATIATNLFLDVLLLPKTFHLVALNIFRYWFRFDKIDSFGI